MNGIHDLGGMHGLGPILNEENEPYFHHEWERRVFPLFASLFVGGHFNVDEFRHAIERMDPATTWRRATTSTGCTHLKRCCWKKG